MLAGDRSGLQLLRVLCDALGGLYGTGNAVSLIPCGGCGSGPPLVVYAGDTATPWLAPGRRALRLHGSAGRDSTLGVWLARTSASDPS